jgi:hypothetical protein
MNLQSIGNGLGDPEGADQLIEITEVVMLLG